jgi:hypothetical protein
MRLVRKAMGLAALEARSNPANQTAFAPGLIYC